MTDNEKALIRFDPVAAANNRTLLAALSVRSGYNMSEVRDVMVVYDEVRSQINSLASWKERGEEMPSISDSEARLKIVEKVKKEKEQGALWQHACAHAWHAWGCACACTSGPCMCVDAGACMQVHHDSMCADMHNGYGMLGAAHVCHEYRCVQAHDCK